MAGPAVVLEIQRVFMGSVASVLWVQTRPRGIAQCLWRAVAQNQSPSAVRSRSYRPTFHNEQLCRIEIELRMLGDEFAKLGESEVAQALFWLCRGCGRISKKCAICHHIDEKA